PKGHGHWAFGTIDSETSRMDYGNRFRLQSASAGWLARRGALAVLTLVVLAACVAAQQPSSDTTRAEPVYFNTDVVPLLTKLGCNSGGCHGKTGGQNGFSLSLLGFERSEEFEAIVQEAR